MSMSTETFDKTFETILGLCASGVVLCAFWIIFILIRIEATKTTFYAVDDDIHNLDLQEEVDFEGTGEVKSGLEVEPDPSGPEKKMKKRSRKVGMSFKLMQVASVGVLILLTYLLLVSSQAPMWLSGIGALCVFGIFLRYQIGDEIRRQRVDRLTLMMSLFLVIASFLSMGTYAMKSLKQGEIYEGPARIVGYDTSSYTNTDQDPTTRSDLMVQWGKEWGCPLSGNKVCNAYVNGAMCQVHPDERLLDEQDEDSDEEKTYDELEQENEEYEKENEELQKEVEALEEENAEQDTEEEYYEEEVEDEMTEEEAENDAEVTAVEEEELEEEVDYEAIEGEVEEEYIEEVEQNLSDDELVEEYEEVEEEIEDEVEEVEEEAESYEEAYEEEIEEDNEEVEEAEEDEEELLDEEETVEEEYEEQTVGKEEYEETEEAVAEEEMEVEEEAEYDEEIEEEEEMYEDDDVYVYDYDDDVYENEYWYYDWDSVWGEYACEDLFDSGEAGVGNYDANTPAGSDDIPFINIYASCKTCEAYILDYFAEEAFEEVEHFRQQAIMYFVGALCGFIGSMVAFVKYQVSPTADNQVELLGGDEGVMA